MVNPFGNIGNLMSQAKNMQEKFKQIQDDLEKTHITGEAGAGLVQITLNGTGEALNIKIDDSVYQEDRPVLQGLIVAAINDAQRKRESKKKEMMGSLMGGMGLPPGFDFLTKGE